MGEPDRDASQRAIRLREQIDKLTREKPDPAASHSQEGASSNSAKSPRDFINQRMRELDKKQ